MVKALSPVQGDWPDEGPLTETWAFVGVKLAGVPDSCWQWRALAYERERLRKRERISGDERGEIKS